jgi:hypothetical protein
MTPIQWVAEQIADLITGGALTRARRDALLYEQKVWELLDERVAANDRAAEVANIAAQRDEAIARAERAELLEYDNRNGWANSERFSTALRAILTARNITEARKIAKQALGEGE